MTALRSSVKKLALRLGLIHRPADVHLLHVGKTGGSALKAALRGKQGDGFDTLHLHHHHFYLPDIPDGDGFFFFVRDPMRRFVSGFYSRLRQGQPRYFFPWSEEEKEAFALFPTPDALASALSDPERRADAERAMRAIPHVRDFYTRWLGPPDYFASRQHDLVFVGSQEHLREDFERLKRALGVADDLQLPSDPEKAHRRPEGLDGALSPAARANLAAWYAEDYAFLKRLADRYDHLPRYDPAEALERA